MTEPSRRDFLRFGGLALAGVGFVPNRPMRSAALEVIEMRSDALGAHVWFDPIGLYVEPGTTLRWVVRENVHTTTAYHPKNDHHPLRIPERAAPWDSGYLVNPGDHFEVRLTTPGVYDYYCVPHEAAGMVGRIVVGSALGPGAQPFDYWTGRPGTEHWRRVPDAARASLPSIERIVAAHRVRPHLAPPRRGGQE
jgi:plastocyanin